MKGGTKVEGIFESHKDGYVYMVERSNFGPGTVDNMKFVYGEPFMPITVWKGLDATGHPIFDPAKDPTNGNLVDVCPSFLGGTNYMVPAYDAGRKTAFISGNYWCETIKSLPPEPWKPYEAYVQADFHMHVQPGIDGAGGFVKAIDVNLPARRSGRIRCLTRTGVACCRPPPGWSSAAVPTPATCLLWTRIPARCSGSTARTRAWQPPRSPTRSTASSMFATSLASAVRFRSGPARSRTSTTRTRRRAA